MSKETPDQVLKSNKLDGVCYDIRGAVLDEAKRLEEAGHSILKLNIGNPAPFGFQPPDEIMADIIRNLHNATGYTDSQGLFSARKAIVQHYQTYRIFDIDIDQVYIGNGVSELIVMSMQALLNDGDEVLIPSPDYPLWTAAVKLAGGNPVHYRCDESAGWFPDIDDIKQKINGKTKAIVLINPNNPTGAVYDTALLKDLAEVARQNKLMLFSDEIYDKILYDQAKHTPTMTIADDIPTITFSGFSKNYRAAGFRVGWMVLRDQSGRAKDFSQGLKMLASMRLCSNVPAQFAVQTGLHGYQSINDLVAPSGRLRNQRDIAWERINSIPGISCVKPQGALYLFPKLDPSVYPIVDDEKLMLKILKEEKILLVHGRAFNWPDPDHFRIVFLPNTDMLNSAMDGLERFFHRLRMNSK